MTQEELDALMAGGVDEEDLQEAEKEQESGEAEQNAVEEEYRVEADKSWPPPPPTDDHKVVHQLDDVTRDSEVKATEIFDKLEAISNFFMNTEEDANRAIESIENNIKLFEKLNQQFPNIDTFSKALEENKKLKSIIEGMIENSQNGSDEAMMAMDIMQYQDIHRQKIERVINVMRALSGYMNSLFEGRIEDDKRVSSAVHIHGDNSTKDLVDNEDIEALIASFRKK